MSEPLALDADALRSWRTDQIERLIALIEAQIEEGRYPGCQIAIARHGRLLLERSFGHAQAPGVVADPAHAKNDSLWLLFSNTKVLTAVCLWVLFEQGAFRFTDRLSDHVPEFARHGKRDITILQVITHQGGFPNAEVPPAAWHDRAALREAVSNFTLEWTPGSRVSYHSLSAHWALAALIEALTQRDFRKVIKELVIKPLGLGRELFVGLPEGEDGRVTTMYEPDPSGTGLRDLRSSNSPTWRRGGAPGGGAYGTARAMVALYQMMLNGGQLNGVQLLSPRTLAYAIRNHTGDRIDGFMGMPMHRGLGPHLRGQTETIRGLGSIASPGTFGHGGVGSSYCWADPESGVSFAYLTNCKSPDPWHSDRLDTVSNFIHSALPAG